MHLHCVNGNTVNVYRLLKFLGNTKTACVVTHHAEFYYTGNCGHSFACNLWKENECRGCKNVRKATNSYTWSTAHFAWRRMKNAFTYFEKNRIIFTAVSPWVRDRAITSPLVKDYRCDIVFNGLDTSVFHPCPNKEFLLHCFPGLKQGIVFHSTAFFWPGNRDHIKGGWYVVEMARRFPQLTFIIAAIRTKIDIILPQNVLVWGSAKTQQELAMLYSSSDLTLVTSIRETFSMICAESLCCGTPIVGFKAGGPESISLPSFSHFVSYGDCDALERAIREHVSLKVSRSFIAQCAKEKYDKSSMATRYMKLYECLVSNKLS